MADDRNDVVWSPRVPKWKLRRLYQRVAQGIWDDDLIDDVGTTLFCRCRDILLIHSFHYSVLDEPDRATRPAGVNLISGKLADVVAFLDELSGLPLPAEMARAGRQWRETYASTYWPNHLTEASDG